MTEIEALVILAATPGIGPVKIRSLIDYFGSAKEALQADAAAIQTLSGFSRIALQWDCWKKDDSWKKDLELAANHNVRLIPFNSQDYPKRLLEIPDYPAMLYVKGAILPQDLRSIAIVGTRNASIYGNEMAASIARDLASCGFTVISGLARGVDTAAHMGALEQGRTIGVIGSGLANIYPQENRSLGEKMAQHGALISEFSMATPPDRQNFPRRNRIVSGMTLGTLLIEAPLKSGAMITMGKALSHKRKLFALPGRADTGHFQGNHLLIKRGDAKLVENAEDIITHLREHFTEDLFTREPMKEKFRSTSFSSLTLEESHFLKIMPEVELNIDELCALAKLPIYKVQSTLMGLVLKKIVKEFPGKIYKKQTLPAAAVN